MVDTLQINNDRRWLKVNLELLTKDLQHIAQRNPASYEPVFKQNLYYITKQLNAEHREFSTGTDEEYCRHMRLLLRKLLDALTCTATSLQNANEIMARLRKLSELIDETKTTSQINNTKGHFNDIIQLICNVAQHA